MVKVKAGKQVKFQDDYVPSNSDESETDIDESEEEEIEEEEGSEEGEGEEEVDDDMDDVDMDVVDLSHNTIIKRGRKSVSVAAADATVKAAKAKKQPASAATKVPAKAEIKGKTKVPAPAEIKVKKTVMKSQTKVRKGRANEKKIVEKVNCAVKDNEEKKEYIHDDNKHAKILDVSLDQHFNKSKYILDDRYYTMVGTTQIKNRGVSFDQLVIGRNPLINPKDPDDKGKGAFRFNMPLKTIEPFYKAICGITHRTPMDRNGVPMIN